MLRNEPRWAREESEATRTEHTAHTNLFVFEFFLLSLFVFIQTFLMCHAGESRMIIDLTLAAGLIFEYWITLTNES